jgi:hypothetical protein
VDRIVARCVCGKEIGEVFGDAYGVLMYACDKCRDTLADFGFEERQPRHGRFLVLHRLDLKTGRVFPSEAEVFQDFQRGDRSPTRGGRRLDASILTQALARRRELAGKGHTPCP